MTRNHFAPGKFQVRLTIPGPPEATRHFYEVPEAKSPEAAGEIALEYWRSTAWPGHGSIEKANRVVEVFRYAENGELEAASSFNFLLSKKDAV